MQLAGDLSVIPIQDNWPVGAELLFVSNLHWNKKVISTPPGFGAGQVARQWGVNEG